MTRNNDCPEAQKAPPVEMVAEAIEVIAAATRAGVFPMSVFGVVGQLRTALAVWVKSDDRRS